LGNVYKKNRQKPARNETKDCQVKDDYKAADGTVEVSAHQVLPEE